MSMKRTALLTLALLPLAWAGCAELPTEAVDAEPTLGVSPDFQGGAFEGPPQLPPFAGVDHDRVDAVGSGQCPPGQIPWRFSGEDDALSELFRLQSGDDWQAPEQPNLAISVVSETCSTPGTASGLGTLRSACDGQRTCTADVTCRGDYQVEYTCGFEDSRTRTARTFETRDGTRRIELVCGFDDPGQAGVARTACVPKICRGKTRRNAQLQCVPDLTIPVIDLRDGRQVRPHRLHISTPFRPLEITLGSRALQDWQLQEAGNLDTISGLYSRAGAVERIFENGLYNIDIEFLSGQPGFLTPGLRGTLWFSDIWSVQGQEVETFRCVAHSFEVQRDPHTHDRFLTARNASIGADCFGEARERASRQEALRRVFGALGAITLQSFPNVISYRHSRAHLSVDMEGRTLVVTNPFDEGTACAPNPPTFFYDAPSDRFDLLTYYRQRQWHTFHIPSLPNQPRRFHFDHASRVTMGISNAELRDPTITVYQFSRIPTLMSVDVSWFTVFHAVENPLGLDAFHRAAGVDPLPFNRSRNTRFEFYLYEHESLLDASSTDARQTTGYPLLARRSAGSADAHGTTVAVDFTVTPEFQRRFFDPGDPYYIPLGMEARRFEVLACLVSDSGNNQRIADPSLFPNSDSTFATIYMPPQRIRHPRLDSEYGVSVQHPRDGRNPWANLPPAVHRNLRSAVRNIRNSGPAPLGCVWANQPLFITPDRYVRPVEPVMDRAWRGQVRLDESGDNDVTGESGGNFGQTCETWQQACNSQCDSECRANPGAPVDPECRATCLPPCLAPAAGRTDAEICESDTGGDSDSSGNEFQDPMYSIETFATLAENAYLRVSGLGEVFGFQALDTYGVEVDLSGLLEDDDEEGPEIPSSPITFDLEYDDGEIKLSIFPPFERAAEILNQGRDPNARMRWAGDDRDGLAFVYTYEKQVKIGPVPGTFVLTLSAGVALNAWFSYRWRRATGEEYPCMTGDDGTATFCIVPRDPARFADAVSHCAETGGRIVAPTSAEEGQVIRNLLAQASSASMWIGGQIGTRYENPDCAARPNEPCNRPSFDTWRWIQNDVEFINENRQTLVTPFGVDGRRFRGFNRLLPVTYRPHGLALERSAGRHDIVNFHIAAQLPFACRYERARRTHYRELGAGLEVEARAGIGIGFCTPNSNLGVCLSGDVDVVVINFDPTFTKWDWTIIGVDPANSRRTSSVDVEVGIGMTVLRASLSAEAKAWIFSRKWQIFSFPGFQVLYRTLYEYSVPSFEFLASTENP
ncbi:MAG: C-type lectin domain-containing protein [Deltaproteobacteria bacterium]|nr:MAG: C-type lectin domain-containing protein [Deltaproteobacteria bacterium]